MKKTALFTGAMFLALAPSVVCAEGEVAPEPKNVPALFNGTDWVRVRRGELLRTFEENVYGVRTVGRPENMHFTETAPAETCFGGKAVKKCVRITYSGPGGTGSLDIAAWIPVSSKRCPAFVHLSPRTAATANDPNGPRLVYLLPSEYIVSRGFAAVAVCDYDTALDWHQAPAKATNGVFKAFGPSESEKRQPSDWGILSAWAWGASRAMDWIEAEPRIDAKHVGVVGLSRNGKAALVAGVTDTRFAMTVSCCSGMGGAKLNHMTCHESETIQAISIAHRWFAPKFMAWKGRDQELPFDQHQFLALVAPRLLYVSSASEDAWAGPRGEFTACVLASPAWGCYGLAGLVQHGFPAPDHPLHAGHVGYHVRSGLHDITKYDWQNYLDFAEGHGWLSQAAR